VNPDTVVNPDTMANADTAACNNGASCVGSPRRDEGRVATRSPLVQREHDTAVMWLAAQWADAAKYSIATNPNGEKNFPSSPGMYPDIVAWVSHGVATVVYWIVEVETADTVTEAEARDEWLAYAGARTPLWLAVPAGCGVSARSLAKRVGASVNRVFEYQLGNGVGDVVEV
jgi:hypothetical protein